MGGCCSGWRRSRCILLARRRRRLARPARPARPRKADTSDHGTAADHRRVLPDDPPEREGAAALPRHGRPGARRHRPVLRLPLLRRRPGGRRPGDQAAARPGHAARLDQGGARSPPTWRRGTARSPRTWRGWNASSSRPRRRSAGCGRCSPARRCGRAIEFRTIPAVTALAIAEVVTAADARWRGATTAIGDLARRWRQPGWPRRGPFGALFPGEFFELERSEITVFVPVGCRRRAGLGPLAGPLDRPGPAARDPGIEAAIAVHDGPARRHRPHLRRARHGGGRARHRRGRPDQGVLPDRLPGNRRTRASTAPKSAGRYSSPGEKRACV